MSSTIPLSSNQRVLQNFNILNTESSSSSSSSSRTQSKQQTRIAEKPLLLEKLIATESDKLLPELSQELQNKIQELFDKQIDLGEFSCSVAEFLDAFRQAVAKSPWAKKVRITPQLELSGSTARQLLLANPSFLKQSLGDPSLSAIAEAPMDLDLRCRICTLGQVKIKACLEGLGALIPIALQQVAKSKGKALSLDFIEKEVITTNQHNRAITIRDENKSFIMRAFGPIEFAIVNEIGRSFQFPADNLVIRWDGKSSMAHCEHATDLTPHRALREALCGAISLYQTDSMDFFCWPKFLCLVGRGQFPAGEDAEKVLMEKTKAYGKTPQDRRLAPRILKAMDNHSPNKACAYGALFAAVQSLHRTGEPGALELWKEVSQGIEGLNRFDNQSVPALAKAFGTLLQQSSVEQALDLLSLALYLNLNAATGPVSRSRYFERDAFSYSMGHGSQVLVDTDPKAALKRIGQSGMSRKEKEAFAALCSVLAPETPFVNGESSLDLKLSDVSTQLLGPEFYLLQRGLDGPSDRLAEWIQPSDLLGSRLGAWTQVLAPYCDLSKVKSENDLLLTLASSRSRALREWALKKGKQITPKILFAINKVDTEYCLQLLSNDQFRSNLKDRPLFRLLSPHAKQEKQALSLRFKSVWSKIPDTVKREILKDSSNKELALIAVQERVHRLSQKRYPDEKRLEKNLAALCQLKTLDPQVWTLLLKTIAETNNPSLKTKALRSFLQAAEGGNIQGSEELRSVILRLIRQSSRLPKRLRQQFLGHEGSITRLFAGSAAATQRGKLEALLLEALEDAGSWPKDKIDLNYLLQVLSTQAPKRQLQWILSCPKGNTDFIQGLGKKILSSPGAAAAFLPRAPQGKRWENCRLLLERVANTEANTLRTAMDRLCLESGEADKLSDAALKAPQTIVRSEKEAEKLLSLLLKKQQFEAAVTLICAYPLSIARHWNNLERELDTHRAANLAEAFIKADLVTWQLCECFARNYGNPTLELMKAMGGIQKIGRERVLQLLRSSRQPELIRGLGRLLFASEEETSLTLEDAKLSHGNAIKLARKKELNPKQRSWILSHQARQLTRASTSTEANKALKDLYQLVRSFPEWDLRPFFKDFVRLVEMADPIPSNIAADFLISTAPIHRVFRANEAWSSLFQKLGSQMLRATKGRQAYQKRLGALEKLAKDRAKRLSEKLPLEITLFILRRNIRGAEASQLNGYVQELKELYSAGQIPKNQMVTLFVELGRRFTQLAEKHPQNEWEAAMVTCLKMLEVETGQIHQEWGPQEVLNAVSSLAGIRRYAPRISLMYPLFHRLAQCWTAQQPTNEERRQLKVFHKTLDPVLKLNNLDPRRAVVHKNVDKGLMIWDLCFNGLLMSDKALVAGLQDLSIQAILYGDTDDLIVCLESLLGGIKLPGSSKSMDALNAYIVIILALLHKAELDQTQQQVITKAQRHCNERKEGYHMLEMRAATLLLEQMRRLTPGLFPSSARMKPLLDLLAKLNDDYARLIATSLVDYQYTVVAKYDADLPDFDKCWEWDACYSVCSVKDLTRKLITGTVFDPGRIHLLMQAWDLVDLPGETFHLSLRDPSLKGRLSALMGIVDLWTVLLDNDKLMQDKKGPPALLASMTGVVNELVDWGKRGKLQDRFTLAYYLVLSLKQLKIEKLATNQTGRQKLTAVLVKLESQLVAELMSTEAKALTTEERVPAFAAIQMITETWLNGKSPVGKHLPARVVQELRAPIAELGAKAATTIAETEPLLELRWPTLQMVRYLKHLEVKKALDSKPMGIYGYANRYCEAMKLYVENSPDSYERKLIFSSLKEIFLFAQGLEYKEIETAVQAVIYELYYTIPEKQRDADPLAKEMAKVLGMGMAEFKLRAEFAAGPPKVVPLLTPIQNSNNSSSSSSSSGN